MALSGFICHDDYLKKTSRLSDEQLGRLFRALMEYHATHEVPELGVVESMAFDFIRADIDRADNEHQRKCENNRKIRLDAIENERQRSSTDVNECDRTKNKNKTKNIEKEKDNENKKTAKRFDPPTVDEVAAYCRERNNGIDAQHFIDYYLTRNWVLSNGKKMSDWKAAVRTWEGNSWNKGRNESKKSVPAQQYEQRDYSGEQDEALQRMIAQMNSA